MLKDLLESNLLQLDKTKEKNLKRDIKKLRKEFATNIEEIRIALARFVQDKVVYYFDLYPGDREFDKAYGYVGKLIEKEILPYLTHQLTEAFTTW